MTELVINPSEDIRWMYSAHKVTESTVGGDTESNITDPHNHNRTHPFLSNAIEAKAAWHWHILEDTMGHKDYQRPLGSAFRFLCSSLQLVCYWQLSHLAEKSCFRMCTCLNQHSYVYLFKSTSLFLFWRLKEPSAGCIFPHKQHSCW